MNRITHVKKRSGAIVPFNPDRITNAIYSAAVAVGGRDKEQAEILSKIVVKTLRDTLPEGHIPEIEEIQDVVEQVLIKQGHSKVAKEYILYRDESNRRRREKSQRASVPSVNIPWRKMWYTLDWAVSHNLHTIALLNKRIADGEFPHIVHESENYYEEQLRTVIELISKRIEKLRMVFVSGPSSSGKTTTTIKIEQRMKKLGYRFVSLNVDHYFFDLELHPKDEFGDYDFETPQALDLKLINEHLKRLCNGEEIKIPYYDFKTGTRYLDRTPLKLEKGDILLIDSLHGLYPPFSQAIPEDWKFKLYLEPLLQLKASDGNYVHWTDLRLIRRMLRDSSHRAYNPQKTLEHWHYVRNSEKRNIIPYNMYADYIVNTGMPYELPLYAARLSDNFAEWEKKYEGDPLREDAYKRAKRVHKVLKEVTPIKDDSPVPSDSVLREFIGGSSLEYK